MSDLQFLLWLTGAFTFGYLWRGVFTSGWLKRLRCRHSFMALDGYYGCRKCGKPFHWVRA